MYGKMMKLKEVPEKGRKYVKEGIRKAFKWSYLYEKPLKEARVELPRRTKKGNLSKIPDVFYRCNSCEALWKKNEINVDHVIPVVPIGTPEVEMMVGEYCYRALFNPTQVLCKYCHKTKTTEENAERKRIKNNGK